MALSNSDIVIFFSGGANNSDPDLSIGGDISSQIVPSDRLFDNVTAAQAAAGYTDYRCVYFENISTTDTLFSASVYIDSQVSGGSDVMIGLEKNNERQDIFVTNATSVASGDFTIQMYDYFSDSMSQITVAMDPSIESWASNLQAQVNTLPGMGDVVVVGSYLGSTAYFTLTFGGSSSNRYHEAFEFVGFSQSFLDVNSTMTIQKVSDGGPKLKTAAEIASETSAPANVVFSDTSSGSAISVGDLMPGEFFAVWMRRTVAAGAAPTEADGFRLKIRGDTL